MQSWLSVDPLAEEYAAWTPYNYTMQNPINMVDPTGMGPDDPLNPEGPVPSAAGLIYEQLCNLNCAVFNFMAKGVEGMGYGDPGMNIRKEVVYGDHGSVKGTRIIKKPEGSWTEAAIETFTDGLSFTPFASVEKNLATPVLFARVPLKNTLITFTKKLASGEAITVSTNLPQGFNETKAAGYSKGNKVYTDGKRWISPDQTSHKGGIWKMWESEANVGTTRGRATTDAELNVIDK